MNNQNLIVTLAGGADVALAHNLKAVPTKITPMRDTALVVVGADASVVYFSNPTETELTATFRVSREHSVLFGGSDEVSYWEGSAPIVSSGGGDSGGGGSADGIFLTGLTPHASWTPAVGKAVVFYKGDGGADPVRNDQVIGGYVDGDQLFSRVIGIVSNLDPFTVQIAGKIVVQEPMGGQIYCGQRKFLYGFQPSAPTWGNIDDTEVSANGSFPTCVGVMVNETEMLIKIEWADAVEDGGW